MDLLERMGLFTFIPHLMESDSEQAEAIHPLGVGGKGEEPIETDIGDAARATAETMCPQWAINRAEDEGYEIFCPVLQTLPNVQLVRDPRGYVIDHTPRRTAAWYAQLLGRGEAFVASYRKLAGTDPSLKSSMGA